MKKLLIIQNTIPHYRKPVYNELSKYYQVTVLHSGDVSVNKGDHYNEIITPVRRMGPFFHQSGVLREMRRGGYDVVIAMFDLRWIANILAVFFKARTRFLYWGHRYSANTPGNAARDLFMRLSDGVILYSDGEVGAMVSRGIPQSMIFIAPNTMHIPNHSDGSVENKDSLLFVGRLQPRKKIDMLVRAFSDAAVHIPDAITLDIVGTGPELARIKAAAEQCGVTERVIFHGEIVDHEKLKPLFHRAYAYFSPGPVGLSVLHSFAYGVPIVTAGDEYHGPEFDNVSDRHNAMLYGSYDELREIIIKLCNDNKFAAKLGRNAYKLYASGRTIDTMVKGFRAAIENNREPGE